MKLGRVALTLYLSLWVLGITMVLNGRAKFFFAGYDGWVGFYRATKIRWIRSPEPEKQKTVTWYVCLLPFCVFLYPRFRYWHTVSAQEN